MKSATRKPTQTCSDDYCECCYCGYFFPESVATNNDLLAVSVTCTACGREMNVFVSANYVCTPLEEDACNDNI